MDASELASLMDEEDEDLITEFSVEEFQRELQKYRKSASKSKKNSVPKLYDMDTKMEDVEIEGVDFEQLLLDYLVNYLTREEAERVTDEFMKLHYKYVDSLSLDDIERIAPVLKKQLEDGEKEEDV